MSHNERKTSIGGQFAPRLVEMLESPAYRVLSLSARRILDRIEIEMAHHGGIDNGRLPVTYDNFEQYGLHRHSVGPAIREAIALGFIEITTRGCAGNAEHRSPNLFRLTYRQTKYGKPTNEWRRIATMEDAEAIGTTARKTEPSNGYRVAKFQWRKMPNSSGGNHHRKPESPVAETTTTGLSAKTTTTLDISGEGRTALPREAASEARTPQCAVASERRSAPFLQSLKPADGMRPWSTPGGIDLPIEAVEPALQNLVAATVKQSAAA